MKPDQNFYRGGGGCLVKPSFCGGGMDIFWLELHILKGGRSDLNA